MVADFRLSCLDFQCDLGLFHFEHENSWELGHVGSLCILMKTSVEFFYSGDPLLNSLRMGTTETFSCHIKSERIGTFEGYKQLSWTLSDLNCGSVLPPGG